MLKKYILIIALALNATTTYSFPGPKIPTINITEKAKQLFYYVTAGTACVTGGAYYTLSKNQPIHQQTSLSNQSKAILVIMGIMFCKCLHDTVHEKQNVCYEHPYEPSACAAITAIIENMPHTNKKYLHLLIKVLKKQGFTLQQFKKARTKLTPQRS